jgi:hypothetical protein
MYVTILIRNLLSNAASAYSFMPLRLQGRYTWSVLLSGTVEVLLVELFVFYATVTAAGLAAVAVPEAK